MDNLPAGLSLVVVILLHYTHARTRAHIFIKYRPLILLELALPEVGGPCPSRGI
jgi:hypothetical protein